jgi:hypothetical protein
MISPRNRENFDALMRLNEFRFKRWQDRRTYEWRVNFALWAWMAAAIYYLQIDRKICPPPIWASMIVVGFIIGAHALWVHFNWVRNQKDINQAFYFWDAARVLLPGQRDPPPCEDQRPGRHRYSSLRKHQRKWYSFLCDAAPLSEIIITTSLAFTYLALDLFGRM